MDIIAYYLDSYWFSTDFIFMKQRKNYLILILSFLLLTNVVYGGKIVRPWRSTTEIVKVGESFEVWFYADNGQTINAIDIQGPYNTVNCSFTTTTGSWVYDQMSGNTYNTKITVTVPVDAPADRYSLIIKTSSGDEVSWGGVKVVSEFKEDYYIMHMSDGHLYQSGYNEITLHARKSAMIDIANIIDCEIIIETGDNMYNVRNHPERETAYFLGIEHEDIKGMADATAATFMIPGDHDAYAANDWPQASEQVNADFFNDYYGLQNSCFSYGKGRFMLLNNAWDVSTSSAKNHQYQVDDAITWLENAGAGGNFFLTAGHCYDKMHEFVDDHQPLDIVLAGDKHHVRTNNPFPFDDGSAEIAYIAGSIRDHFEFNLFKVNEGLGTFSVISGSNSVVEVLNNGDQDTRSTWVPNLTLDFTDANDGSSFENTATIVNKFNFPVEGARVRFVMPLGYTYEVTNATVMQEFDGDSYQIIDATLDLPANSTNEIYIRADDLCPDDPDKTEPGLCGCGVPEGTCPSFTLAVNSGSGNGDFLPLEEITIVADPPVEDMEFYKWTIESGTPSIKDSLSETTTLKLGYSDATISATYKEIQKFNIAGFISQDVPTLNPGETVSVSITMKNTGTTTWTNEGAYSLGFIGQENTNVWGINKVDLEAGEEVLPVEEKTFSFDIHVPVDDGLYVFKWQMFQNDSVRFGSPTEVVSLQIGDAGIYLDACDQLTNWKSSAALKLNNSDKQQGSSSIEFTGMGTDEFKKVYSTPYNSRGTVESTELKFWYYVSDVSQLQGANQVEIGSAGKPDANEYNWNLTGLSNGWNYIVLKTSEAGVMGVPNLNAINWFRLYRKKSGSVTTKIDGIQLIDPNAPTEYNLVVNNGSGSGSYYPGENPVITAYDAPVGQEFNMWVVNSGLVTLSNENAELTYFTMPEEDVEITATYSSLVSIEETKSEQVRIYPNPANSELFIDLQIHNSSVVEVSLLDISGREIVYNTISPQISPGKNSLRIPIENIKSGTYIVKLGFENKVLTRKIVVQ